VKEDDSRAKAILSAMLPGGIKFFNQVSSAGPALNEGIRLGLLSLRQSRSVRDALILAYLRNTVQLVDVPLNDGNAQTRIDVWKYWGKYPAELKQLCTTGTKILTYLMPGFSSRQPRETIIRQARCAMKLNNQSRVPID
jgi:hypothetical protein